MQQWVHLLMKDAQYKDVLLSDTVEKGVFMMIMAANARAYLAAFAAYHRGA